MTRTEELIQAVVRTHEIDESGDANLLDYLRQCQETGPETWYYQHVDKFLEAFLIWANGPNWEQFLKTAKVGDRP